MPTKFVSRAAFTGAAIYSGATALLHRTRLWDALKAAIGLTDVDRVVVTATGALTIEQCGTLLVDASGGNIVLTLPASGVDADEALYEIDRLDATANTVTFVPAGADTIGGAASVLVAGTMRLRLPAGKTDWRVHSISGGTPAAARVALGLTRTAFATAGGTVDAITAAFKPVFTAHDQTALIMVECGGANATSTPTFNPDGVSAKTIVKGSNAALVPGDIPGANFLALFRYDASLDKYILLNPTYRPLAAGDVLQSITFANDAGGSSTAGAVSNISASSKSITPLSDSSILTVLCFFQGKAELLAATNTTATFSILESGATVGDQRTLGVNNGSGNNRDEAPLVVTARLLNTAKVARPFTLGAATSNAGAPAYGTNQIFIIMETKS